MAVGCLRYPVCLAGPQLREVPSRSSAGVSQWATRLPVGNECLGPAPLGTRCCGAQAAVTASPAIRASALSPLPLPKEGAKMASGAPIQQEACPENTDTYLWIVAYLYWTLSLWASGSCCQHRQFVLLQKQNIPRGQQCNAMSSLL